MRIKNVKDVVSWRLCVGCGACTYICPENKIKLVDILEEGIRPMFDSSGCNSCTECLRVCPGYETTHTFTNGSRKFLSELELGWGPILEVWEGYATDVEIRYYGSSAGVATEIALYCLENEDMAGVIHIGHNKDNPLHNKTFLSDNRKELLSRTGSRYSPASPCDSLEQIESASSPCVFIGKPCDVAGLKKARVLKPELDKNVGLTIGIFCAGTPSTQALFELLKLRNINPDQVAEIRFRGKGWPGMFSVRLKGEESPSTKIPYIELWGFLKTYRPFRCYLCPDTTSEFADISCGDFWSQEIKEGDLGSSLILARTERGRRIIQNAIAAGYIHLTKVNPQLLEDSQKNLLLKRKTIWGKLFAMKMFVIPTPKLEGFHLFKNWIGVSFQDKRRSILGTIRRIIQRKYMKPSGTRIK